MDIFGESTRFTTLFVLLLGILAFVGCGSNAVPVHESNSLDGSLSDILNKGESARFDSLIEGDWEKIRVFAKESWSRVGLQEEVRQELGMPDYYMGKGSVLLVFEKDRVVHGISIGVYMKPGVYRRSDTVAGTKSSGLVVRRND